MQAERLKQLEYLIRQSMTVRDDQEYPAAPAHLSEATECGIAVAPEMSKGDLLSAVQTLIRAAS